MQGIAELMVPIVTMICVFTFLSVAAWAGSRQKEREAFYKNETIKRITELQGTTGVSAIEYLREEDRLAVRRRREAHKLSGLINIGVGIGLTIFLARLAPRACLVGLIPLLVGVALLAHSYLNPAKE